MTRGFRHRAALALAFAAALASTGAAAGVPSMRATETDSITVTPRGVCATAVENRHLVADSAGGVCPPLALDAATGCCLEPKRVVSKEMCAESCSERGCCDAYAACVVCCHDDIARRIAGSEGHDPIELAGFTPMHPAMWRRWLITHDPDGVRKLEGEPTRGETFAGADDHAVAPFDYCKHRCRTNSGVTKYENAFQDDRHHCFRETYVETVGADDTRSPGREKNHDEAGDWKIAPDGRVVALGLAKIQPRPSDDVNGGPDVDETDAAGGANVGKKLGGLVSDGLASVTSLIGGGVGERDRSARVTIGGPEDSRIRKAQFGEPRVGAAKSWWVFDSLAKMAGALRGYATGGDVFTTVLEFIAAMTALAVFACCCLLRDSDVRRAVRHV